MDEFGVPNGDNSTCTDACDSDVCLFLTPDGKLMYDSAEDIGGFQFNVDSLISVGGGAASNEGLSIESSSSSVIGFSFSGNIIPAGSGTLLMLEFVDDSPLCPSDLILSSSDGSILTSSLSCEF